MNYIMGGNGCVQLQATLAASSSCGADSEVRPHHPLTCPSELAYHADGSFACEHAVAPPDDVRTQYALDHSVAILLLEQLARRVVPSASSGPTLPPDPG